MNDDKREIKVLKSLVKAQEEMIRHYKVGGGVPERVLKAIDSAKDFYEVDFVSDIK